MWMKDFNPVVRLYWYEDGYKGWGDAGTLAYVRVTKDEFEASPLSKPGDGNPLVRFTESAEKRLYELVGYNRFDHGSEWSTVEEHKEEVAKLESRLNRIKDIH